jgi:hypothetical protein
LFAAKVYPLDRHGPNGGLGCRRCCIPPKLREGERQDLILQMPGKGGQRKSSATQIAITANSTQRRPFGEIKPKSLSLRAEKTCPQFGQRTITDTSDKVKTLNPRGTPPETSALRPANFAEHLGQISSLCIGPHIFYIAVAKTDISLTVLYGQKGLLSYASSPGSPIL